MQRQLSNQWFRNTLKCASGRCMTCTVRARELGARSETVERLSSALLSRIMCEVRDVKILRFSFDVLIIAGDSMSFYFVELPHTLHTPETGIE